MMNYPCYDAAAAPWCYPEVATGDTISSFADLITGYSTDDLFELASWEQGGGGAGASAAAASAPEVMRSGGPPSEAEMAAWLCAIVRGDVEELVDDGGGQDAPEDQRPPSDNTSSSTTTTGKKEKLPTMGSTKQAPGKLREALQEGFPKRSHHGQAHKLTEKKRRNKINEKLRTLQQLVPGCDDKSNQAATLDKTIQYMKSLQQHVQAMSDGSGGGGPARPTAAAEVYPVVPQAAMPPMPGAPTMVLATAPTVMVVPLGGMLQLPHYPAPAVPFMMPGGGAGSSPSGGHRHGSSSSKGNKQRGSIRNLRQKH